MRLATYNIQSLRGSRSGVIQTLREAAADVVCLQEVPRFALSAARSRRLARRAGLVAVGGGRLAGDTAVYVHKDLVVRQHRRLALSRTTGLHRRGATVVTTVAKDALTCTVVSVHLGLDAHERVRHVREIVAALALFDGPVVVAGDINEGPDGAAWQLLVACVGPAANAVTPTFPAVRPVHVLDTAFVGAGAVAAAIVVMDSAASDHRPVAFELH